MLDNDSESNLLEIDFPDNTPADTKRLDWLGTHSMIRVTSKGNIKIKIEAKPNGTQEIGMLRNYIDQLMGAF